MNILIIGKGGREHALAWKIDQSERVKKVFVAPGNYGTAQNFENVEIDVLAIDELLEFSIQKKIDLVIVGPEEPLSLGIVDRFTEKGIQIFGPTKDCALFESSKDFTKNFLNTHQIPTAKSYTVSDFTEAMNTINKMTFPLVIKADGLCSGKGVFIVENITDATEILENILLHKQFGNQGDKVVLEEFLEGVEQSLLCFVSNNRIIPMESAQDYKKIGEGDTGLNTGGIGAYSPSLYLNPIIKQRIDHIIKQIEEGFEKDGYQFNGILFIGFMIKDDQPKVLEFNVRFGDPETEVILPRLQSDLIEIIEKTMAGTLQKEDLVWDKRVTVGVVLHSKDYPQTCKENYIIDQLPTALSEEELLFHNGTRKNKENQLITTGGRVLTPVAFGHSHEEARHNAYELVKKIKAKDLRYRTDIAKSTNEQKIIN